MLRISALRCGKGKIQPHRLSRQSCFATSFMRLPCDAPTIVALCLAASGSPSRSAWAMSASVAMRWRCDTAFIDPLSLQPVPVLPVSLRAFCWQEKRLPNLDIQVFANSRLNSVRSSVPLSLFVKSPVTS